MTTGNPKAPKDDITEERQAAEDVLGESSTDKLIEGKPIFKNPFPEFQFLGNVVKERQDGESKTTDAYFHDEREEYPDYPKLFAIAVSQRYGDEESDYSYSRLTTFSGANGWEIYKKGMPVFLEDRRDPNVFVLQALRMLMERGIVSEEDLLETIQPDELHYLDPEDRQRVLAIHGFSSMEELQAAREALYIAAAEREAKERGYPVERAKDFFELSRAELIKRGAKFDDDDDGIRFIPDTSWASLSRKNK